MKGKFTAEEVNQFVAAATGIPYEHLWQTFVIDCQNMHVDQSILHKLTDLRKNFHLVLITGNMDCFDRFTVTALGLSSYCDEIVNSFNEGKLKSDDEGETFKKYVKGGIEQAFLIEDSRRSCEVFSNIGGTALQVTADNSAKHHLNKLPGKF